jgi:hypothetical protein
VRKKLNLSLALPDTARGVAQLGGQSAGFMGIQSYPSSPMTFRDIGLSR